MLILADQWSYQVTSSFLSSLVPSVTDNWRRIWVLANCKHYAGFDINCCSKVLRQKNKTTTGSFCSDVKPRISLPMLILRRLALPGHTTWNWCKHTCGLKRSKWNGRIFRRDTCKEQLLWMIPRRRMRRGRRRRGEAKLCCERRWNTTAMPHSVTWLR